MPCYSLNMPISSRDEGAGFLNSLEAASLARFYETAGTGTRVPVEPIWSKHSLQGSHRVAGGNIVRSMSDDGDHTAWATDCDRDCENIVWGTAGEGDNVCVTCP